MSHAVIGLIVQFALWLLTGSAWVGCYAAVFGFVMREVAQAEYRWIELHGGLRAAMPWWQGLDVRLWTRHSCTDVIYPTLATVAAAVALQFLSVFTHK